MARIWSHRVSAAVRGGAVHGGDRRLQLVRTGHAAPHAGGDDRSALRRLRLVPPVAVLVGEPHEARRRRRCGRPARVGEQQQREQAVHLGLVGHQLGEQAGEADGLGAEVVAAELVARRRRVALVEDEVDDGEHARGAGPGSSASPGTR